VLLIQTAVLASLASASGAPTIGDAGRAAPMWAVVALAVRAPLHRLRLMPACGLLAGKPAVPCNATISGPLLDALPPASASYAATSAQLPSLRSETDDRLGGFMNFDVMKALHLSAGPRLSWLTPDSPREDLLRLRVVAPSWGVRYTWHEVVSVGVATGSRFLMLGEDWPVVDVLMSEASIEFLLP